MAEVINLDLYREEKNFAAIVFQMEGVRLNVMELYKERLIMTQGMQDYASLSKKTKRKKKNIQSI
ncbi:MAG: hypothetical protein ACK41T_03750 [Pseudobdellovibrio sp.]